MIERSRFRRRDAPVSCREVGRVLQSYLDDDVAPDFAAKIADHLDDCRRCGLELETYRRIKTSLGQQRPTVDAEVLGRLRDFGSSLTDD